MILRKPYAFLIKHFKLIHLILSSFIIYLAVRTYQLHNFVSYYIDEGWVERLNFKASTYVDLFIYMAIIFVIIIAAIVLLLMKKKDKPTKFYLIIIVFYFILFLLFIFSHSMLNAMETKNMDTRLVSVLSDINLMAFYTQLVVTIFALIRGLGFNFKKFNFEDDIEQLNIEMNDREEVEVNFELDTENFMTMLRRKRREFKYFYKENKYYIIIFAMLGVFILGLSIYLNINVYNKIYVENETFRAGSFNTTITDTYITKKDYKNNTITKSNESYLIIKLKVKNITDFSSSFSANNYKLISGAAIYNPTIKEYYNFIDFGEGYNDDIIKPNSTREFILIYLIDDRSLKNDLIIRYRNKIVYQAGKFTADYIKILVKYKNIDKEKIVTYNNKLTEKLIFNKSLLKDTKLIISNYEIKDSFLFSYNYCINDDCKTYQDIIKSSSNSNYLKTILAIDTSLIIDENIFQLTGFELIEKYGIINYKLNEINKEHKISLINQTPINYKGSVIYIEVLSELKNANEISIVFKIRNKEYIYKLK